MTEHCVSQKVSNPNFIQDLKRYLSLPMSDDDLKDVLKFISKRSPTTYEKLQTLIDRVEFLEHLSIVNEEARRCKYQFSGHEVRGIDWDIDSLRIYLALTCVDILSTNFQPFDNWLLSHCEDFSSSVGIQCYLSQKSKEYRNVFQLSSNFVKAFSQAPESLQKSISKGLAVRRANEMCSDIPTIATYLYKVRNKYTHEGRRFFNRPIVVARQQSVGPRDEDALEIKASFDVVDAVLSIAKEQAIRILKKYANEEVSPDGK